MRLLAVTVLACSTLTALAGPLDDKGPPYFVDRYGPAISTKTESKVDFTHGERGGVTLQGQFSLRVFRQGELRVQSVFFLPSLKLAAVRLQLNRRWTEEQIQAALKAYGGDWKLVKRGFATQWVASDGSLAISLLTWLEIQSKAIVDAVAKELAESDAKRKAVPKF